MRPTRDGCVDVVCRPVGPIEAPLRDELDDCPPIFDTCLPMAVKVTLMRYLVPVSILLGVTIMVRAQESTDFDAALKATIGLIAKPARDSIVLRWAPSKPGVWRIGIKVGYRVERAEVGNNRRVGRFTPLLDSAIKPWPYERWLAYAEGHPTPSGADTTDFVAVAYSLAGLFADESPAREDYPTDDLASIDAHRNELESRFGFAMYAVDRSSTAADGLGLRFVDRTVRPGASYSYRVYLAGSPEYYRLDTGSVTVTASAADARQHRPIMAIGGDRQILLQWHADRFYASYNVDRSENNGATFRRLTRLPVATLRPSLPSDDDTEIFLDSTAAENTIYVYRIYGNSPFAAEDLIGEVRGATRDVTPPAKPFLPNPEHVDARTVRIRWDAQGATWNDLAGFRVGRAQNDSGPFRSLAAGLLPPDRREYFDSTFAPEGSNYYIVEAIDTAGNISWSNSAYVALIDSTPPDQPTWIDGRMDSNGVVTLRLRAHRERDFMGYRLFRANAPDHEFSLIHSSFGSTDSVAVTDTVFRDTVTIQTLTRHTYYRAVALDRNYNESAPSTILPVLRPDVIAPASPVIVDVAVTDTTVRLLFARSPAEDVAYHVVYRSTNDGNTWDSIARVDRVDTTFVDRAVRMSTPYAYSMTAVDSSGLRSDRSMAALARPYDPGTRPGVTQLNATYDRNSGAVSLRWTYNGLAEDYWFVIYRAGGDGGLRQHARVAGNERTFVDRAIGSDVTTATYAVRVVTRSGAESLLEEKVGVEIAR